jgi:hypothetical protein
VFIQWSSFDLHIHPVYNKCRMKRTHSIRIPVTLAEQREAQKLAERLDVPLAQMLRKMLRDAVGENYPRKKTGSRAG